MYRDILAATDGSDSANKAVKHAATLAKATGARLTIVNVTQMWSSLDIAYAAEAGVTNPVGEYEAMAAKSAARVLAAAKALAAADGTACEILHVQDRAPAEGIVQHCDRLGERFAAYLLLVCLESASRLEAAKKAQAFGDRDGRAQPYGQCLHVLRQVVVERHRHPFRFRLVDPRNDEATKEGEIVRRERNREATKFRLGVEHAATPKADAVVALEDDAKLRLYVDGCAHWFILETSPGRPPSGGGTHSCTSCLAGGATLRFWR